MDNDWKFRVRVGHLELDNSPTSIPVAAFGCTQQGYSHFEDCIGNQDALTVSVRESWVIGVVTDGCSSANTSNYDEKSMNDAGAKILGRICISVIENILSKYQHRTPNPEFLRNAIQLGCIDKLERLAHIVGHDDRSRKLFLYNYMTATMLISVVFRSRYYVLSCGDGTVRINDHHIDLKNENGNYLSASMIVPPENNDGRFDMRLRGSGPIRDLKSIVMLSDGFDLFSQDSGFWESFTAFFQLSGDEYGFQDLLTEFRQTVAHYCFDSRSNNRFWPEDDATMFMIKRVIK